MTPRTKPMNRSIAWSLTLAAIATCILIMMPRGRAAGENAAGPASRPAASEAITSETPLSELVRIAHGLFNNDRVTAAWRELERRKDPECVPLLLDSLTDDDAGDLVVLAHDLIDILGDERCFPFLVPIADRYLDAKMTAEMYLGGCWKERRSLWARRTIYFIVEPEQRAKWLESAAFAPGATPAQIEDSQIYRRTKASYARLNAWYLIWRLSYDHTKAPGYRKAVDVWKTIPASPARRTTQPASPAAED